MAVVTNKGVPHRPSPAHFCDRCHTRYVRKWKDKHIALCTLEELNEAIEHLEKRRYDWEERLDIGAMSELVSLRDQLLGAHEKYAPEIVQFAIKEDCILVIFHGERTFISKDEIPEGATKLFIEYKWEKDSREQEHTKIAWFTDIDHGPAVMPWRVIGKLELTNETFKLVCVEETPSTPERN